ncbi:hypothetical protein OQH60_03520 [Campylobacter sp. MIT 21-1685]|uniref:hypothetical protein n=1 Tax=unclassified Campylobacter TaxID=2593542 RepID=UPI00224B37F0|nr:MULTISPECIES: hypothetical protein [unclassified Campylobacter]MCX2682932.1 hypothetical protein [Campylobacter sp. MIT 21-1684]MCX2751214.1 hypothetical protein [Campylobacter sp. MIT 21-1682]MCX2807413.1 hypothetical protein [Campylobacter sp. MIT 21-1685]
MWLFSSDEENKKAVRIVKDMFGNDIELDSNGNVILKDYRFDIQTIFDYEVTKIPSEDKEFLKQDSLRATRLLNETNAILESSPYKSYKPIYLDPVLKTGSNSTLLEFKEWQELYLKDPVKKAIAPWTKAEKAYYESLQTKKERYKYLVIRSGLRSSVIDIPYDAIGGVDDYGRVINPDYEEIFYQVNRHKDTLRSALFEQEWGIAAGILGNPRYLSTSNAGFNARYIQALILRMQVDATSTNFLGLRSYESYGENVIGAEYLGLRKNPLRQQQVTALAKKIKPDKYGMLPYIDEIIGVDWVMDYSQFDIYGDINFELYELTGSSLKDPRDPDSTPESRMEFMEKANFLSQRRVEASALNLPYPPTRSGAQSELEYDTVTLYAKIRAVTPPQGYPNAPTYFIPEYLEELYQQGKLDKRLDPRIPAIYRENFPEYLRKEIEEYARKYDIK